MTETSQKGSSWTMLLDYGPLLVFFVTYKLAGSGLQGSLVATFAFDSDWSTWERHPAGDELVCLLSGEVRMVLDRDGAEEVVDLRKPGEYVLVPRGTWHTARTAVPTNMLFVTPGDGTENKPV